MLSLCYQSLRLLLNMKVNSIAGLMINDASSCILRFEETLEVLKAGGADMNGRDQGATVA